MPITQLQLEQTIVRKGIASSYLILNQSSGHCVDSQDGQSIGVFSSQKVSRTNPPWEETPEKWMFWQPKGAAHPVYIERAIVAAYINLSTLYACHVNWIPDSDINNIASFRVYTFSPSTLFGGSLASF